MKHCVQWRDKEDYQSPCSAALHSVEYFTNAGIPVDAYKYQGAIPIQTTMTANSIKPEVKTMKHCVPQKDVQGRVPQAFSL